MDRNIFTPLGCFHFIDIVSIQNMLLEVLYIRMYIICTRSGQAKVTSLPWGKWQLSQPTRRLSCVLRPLRHL